MKIRMAIPNKGRLVEPALNLLNRLGIVPLERDLLMTRTSDPDIELIFIRASDIPKFVERGVADLGITGRDFIIESKVDVEELLDLTFGQASIVLAAPRDSGIKSVEDLRDGVKVATKFVNITRDYFSRIGKRVDILEVSGAAEVMPNLEIADLVVDTMSTGTTLVAHNLKVVDKLLESSARLIANRRSLVKKKDKISEITLAFKSIKLAEKKKLLMMNVPDRLLKDVLAVLPSMTGPTIAKVEAPEPTWEVYSVINEEEVYQVINSVKKAGAKDILVVPIERIVE